MSLEKNTEAGARGHQGRWVNWILLSLVLLPIFGAMSVVFSDLPMWWGGTVITVSVLALAAWTWAVCLPAPGGSVWNCRAQVAWSWTLTMWIGATAFGLWSLTFPQVEGPAWGATLAATSIASIAVLTKARWVWWVAIE